MVIKKVMIALPIALGFAASANAQDFEGIRTKGLLSKWKDAKTDIDKIAANQKYATKPETWLVKSMVYGNLAYTKTAQGITAEDSLAYLKEAEQALAKYNELEPAGTLLGNDNYKNVPFPIYAAHFNSGIGKFNKKEWDGAFDDLKVSAALSENLIKNKLLNGPIDTNVVLYTGASAQNAKKEAEAIVWYGKLADAKVGGKENEFMYQFSTDYYLRQKDETNFKKWAATGKALYPESKYFSAIDGEFARSSGDFNDVVKYSESKVAADPNNYDLNYNLGAEIFDYLYPRDSAKKPTGDLAAFEQKMIASFQKASDIKPELGLPIALIGFNYSKKADAVSAQIEAVSAEIKNANKNIKPDKTGKLPPAPKELLTKREGLYTQYYSILDQAIPCFFKVRNSLV